MKWVKYVRHTPLRQICSDIARYRALCKTCGMLQREYQTAGGHLIQTVSVFDDKKNPAACIVNEYFGVMQSVVAGADDKIWRNAIMVERYECAYFTNGKSIVRCLNMNCPCYKQNQKFYNAWLKYDAQAKLRNEFWRGVFARYK